MTISEVPVLAVTPHNLDFGTSESILSFTISNIGAGTLTWSITDDQNWVTIDSNSGTTTSETDSVYVTVDRTDLAPGDYNGTLVISSDGGEAMVLVSLAAVAYGNLSGYAQYSFTTIPIAGVSVGIGNENYITNSDGYYALSDIPVGSRTFLASKTGFDPYQTTLSILEGSNVYSFRMNSTTYTHNLYGIIESEGSSEPIPGVIITLINDDGTDSELQTTSDAGGYYQLPSIPEGSRMIRFNSQNYQTFIAEVFIGNSNYQYNVQLANDPGIPTNPSPSDGTTDQSWRQPLILSWECSDPDGDEMEYYIYFGTENPPTQLVSIENAQTHTVTYLLNETTYFWKVDSRDVDNNQTAGPVWNFTTENALESLVDINGHVYETIQIGYQIWMAENLNVYHYRDGSIIPNISSVEDWTNTTSGARCFYDNSASSEEVYGGLYNWYAVDDSRNLAPEGWHVPTSEEWYIMIDFLNSDVGGKLKETGTVHWNSPNTGATNETGFNALPGGYRDSYWGDFGDLGNYAYFWDATATSNGTGAYYHSLSFNSSTIIRSWYWERRGKSVRCIKD